MAGTDETLDGSRRLAGRYRLDESISDRPSAQVWRAFDLELQRPVSVKVHRPCGDDSAAAVLIEARRTQTLKHPAIAQVFDVRCEDGECFTVSELVEGGSLADFSGRQLLSPQHVVRWTTDIAEALEYAHSQGIIHQEIKPANILIGLNGRALLADFGAAQFANATGVTPPSGMINYAAPEQLEGKAADSRSDIYSLGVVLYELLTGKLPYLSTDPKALRQEIVRGARIDTTGIPAQLRRICKKALARDPNARYLTAEKFVDDLRRASASSLTRRLLIAAVGVAVFLVGFEISDWLSSEKPQLIRAKPMVETDWLAHVATLSAKEQVTAVTLRLMELNTGFSGELNETIENENVVGLVFVTDNVQDISPVRALVHLTSLNCFGTDTEKSNGRLADLTPLKGLPLTRLQINDNQRIDDLSPLEGMPLTFFHCRRTSVSDLTPLKHSPLSELVIGLTNVSSLSPLIGMKLKELYCDHTEVADLSPLEGMPLEHLDCHDTPVADLSALHRCPLKILDCHRTLVADLTPLRGSRDLVSLNVRLTKVADLLLLKELPNLKLLWCDFDARHDVDFLSSLKSLQFINDNPVSVFWQDGTAREDE